MSTGSKGGSGKSGGTATKGKRGVVDEMRKVFRGIPVLPQETLVTFEELQDKMGRAPKKDFKYLKRDCTYKEIGNALDGVHLLLQNAPDPASSREGDRAEFEKKVNEKLNEIDAASARYLKRYKKGKKHDAITKLLEQVKDVRENLSSWIAPKYPEGLGEKNMEQIEKAGITPSQLKGVCPKCCEFDRFNDSKMVGKPKVLGAGNVNEVLLIQYGKEEFVFKKEEVSLAKDPMPPMFVGIDVKKDYRAGNRNVACGLVSELLGTKVIPKSRFALVGGEVGLLMDKAPGKTAWTFKDSGQKPWPEELSEKALASLHEQLIDLQVCDVLTGQIDRHGENYLLDFKGDTVTVTGIDCDFSFGSKTSIMGKDTPPPKTLPGAINGLGFMPKLISEKMAVKILGLEFDLDIRPNLVDLLSEDELKATKHRLGHLQTHIELLQSNGCVVKEGEWETWKSKDGLSVTEYLKGDYDPKEGDFIKHCGRSRVFSNAT